MLKNISTMLLFSFALTSFSQPKSVEKNGMKVQWEILHDSLFLEMSAPDQGWIAIGFNEKEGLAGTNLIMGHVADGETVLSDRFIVKPGEHKAMEELGVKNRIKHCEGEESGKMTRISFVMPLSSTDPYHKNLLVGKPYFLLMAYSREDDFAHHSIMRTSVKIIL